MYQRAIVRPPGSSFSEGLTTVDLGRPDLAAAGFQGWDSEKKTFVMGSVCSDGCFSNEMNPGWENDVMTFTGPNHMGGMTMNGRDEFQKISASELRYTYQIEMNGT